MNQKRELDLGIFCQKYGISFNDLKEWCNDDTPLPELTVKLLPRQPGRRIDIYNSSEHSLELTYKLTDYCRLHHIGFAELHSIAHEKIMKEQTKEN